MVPNWVVFGEISRQVFLSLPIEYVEMILLYFISHPIIYHVCCYRYFLLDVTFTMIFADLLSVATFTGGFGSSVSARSVRMDVTFWKFSKILPIPIQWMIP